MATITVTNNTRLKLGLPSPIGQIGPKATVSRVITTSQLENARSSLISLEASGSITFNTYVEGTTAELDTDFMTALDTEDLISSNPAAALHTTTGPTDLTIGAWADGQALRRTGATAVGYDVTDKRGPRIIVGNALAGDTLAVCDYLDAGDGVQLAAALAVSSGFDVYVRPGFIQLSGPLTVPNFVSLTFSSIGSIMQVSTLDRRALILGTGSSVRNMRLQVTTPAVGATGSILVQFATICTIKDCWITSSAYSVATANESLRYFIQAPTAATGSTLTNLYLTLPNFQQAPLAQSMTAISTMMSTTDNTPVVLTNCNVTNGDIAFECQGNAIVSNCTVQAARRRGIVLSTVSWGSYKHIVDACRIQVTSTDDRAGIEVVTGTRAGGATSIISNCTITNIGASPATSTGIRLSAVGNGTIISGCSIDTFPIGLQVAVGQTNVSAKGHIMNYTTGVQDASPSLLNEMRLI